jgi:hypothetical protein
MRLKLRINNKKKEEEDLKKHNKCKVNCIFDLYKVNIIVSFIIITSFIINK